mmetsp:Transcript_3961/g.11867  ORF Transcript_3961/g.11867 Transcript_3961/m.11867 type:complete len:443 (-) Transcript_3961:208-1536(-)
MASDDKLSRKRWLLSVPATALVMFASGIPYSLAVLGPGVESAKKALLQPFIAGLGLRSLAFALTVVAASISLDVMPDRTGLVTTISSVLCALNCLVALGIQKESPALMYWGSTLFGLSNGAFYIIGVVHAAAWMPELPNLAKSLCFGALGAGSLFGIPLLRWLLQRAGIVGAIYWTSLLLTVLFAATTFKLKLPPASWDPQASSEIRLATPSQDSGNSLGIQIFQHHQVYLMMIVVAAGTGPVFGYYAAMFNVVDHLFHMRARTAAVIFIVMNAIVLAGRFGGGFLVTYASFGDSYFRSGAKNLTIAVLSLQLVASLVIGWSESAVKIPVFLACVAVFFLTFASMSTLSAVLARHIFSSVNRGIVYGLSMISSGTATMGFAFVMGHCLAGDSGVSSFAPYNRACTLVTFVGLVAAVAMTTCKAAVGSPSGAPLTTKYETLEG